jgi:energy-coupling factor transporter transmembrane protein EcfT
MMLVSGGMAAILAGLVGRFGLHGLGFSLGVAMNLRSIRGMRYGLRKQRWRGLQLLMMTIVTNALRRADEVALAAEARAFSPDRARPLPVQRGRLDWLPITSRWVY